MQVGDALEVTIMQRGDHEHRHCLNAGQVRKQILVDYKDVKSVRCVEATTLSCAAGLGSG